MLQRTALYQSHIQAGAKMVNFGGWDMPLHYGSQLEEHHTVRKQAGVFDVSHMTIVDVLGADSEKYLSRLLANNVARLTVGQALYSAMLNEQGGIIDDLIVYKQVSQFRLVVNCATRDKDLAWMEAQAQNLAIELCERDLSMLSIQGPKARQIMTAILAAPELNALRSFYTTSIDSRPNWLIACTGYTGEDGFEVMLPHAEIEDLWQSLLHVGVHPIGLGARDTLRLEAGMNLYGTDMDESISPLACNMEWTVAWQPAERDFIGRTALLEQSQQSQQIGLILEQRGVLRAGQTVLCNNQKIGVITSGSFAPSLGHSIALARVSDCQAGLYEVEIRNKRYPVTVVRVPFIRHAKKTYRTIYPA